VLFVLPRSLLIYCLIFAVSDREKPWLNAKTSAWVEQQGLDFQLDVASYVRRSFWEDVSSGCELPGWKKGDMQATGFINAVRIRVVGKDVPEKKPTPAQ
jgi:hypothetical protein